MSKELPKIYEPQKVEDDIYRRWEESGYFNPDKCVEDGVTSADAEHFSMVLPPPNVTGHLHTGHAVMLAIEDALTRFHRMRGHRTLWVPGTDHAAIATQTKVEKLLFEREKKTRHDLGREAFLEEVHAFAKYSHDTIVHQTKKMGSSLDWSREAYTLDEQRNLAVRTAFKKMFDDGLIYRGERVVNWCPHCCSTLADDEVEHKKQNAKLYTFRYDKDFPFEISTTRPETKLGDTAVAVNPKDERYAGYVGETLSADFCGQKLAIKVIADRGVEMEFGTGALGVTPAHSMIDWQMAKKNDLPSVKVIDENGKIHEGFGQYSGKTASEAREMIVECLKKENLISKEEEIENNLSVCYRCSTAIEPLPSLQWFIDVNKKINVEGNKVVPSGVKEASLKELMLFAVQENHTKIIPENFNRIYFHWIEDLQDWCISRQIWFGHRIPVWYRGNEIFCGVEAPAGEGWEQDHDTLDTWFSSGLWTFSTLGWPNKDALDFKNYHPTTVLETGYDILFFWVARMILMTTYLIGDVPFRNVYLHGLVRDERGRKMSKSLGNVIDPLDVIGKYGTDAVRMALMIGSTPGQDTKLGEEKIESYRNFTNKLWNIARYVISASSGAPEKIDAENLTLADKWILEKLQALTKEATNDLGNFQISQAGEKLRDFTWTEFADWYLEISKFEDNKAEKKWILRNILEDLLKLWHPFMPFVTETIWEEMGKKNLLMIERWPAGEISDLIGGTGGTNELRFDLIREIIVAIRNGRLENGIEPKKKIKVIANIKNYAGLSVFKNATDLENAILSQENILKSLRTGIEEIEIISSGEEIENAIQRTVAGISICIPLEGLVDAEKEKAKAEKELAGLEKFIAGLESRLGNKDFVSKAPEHVIKGQQESLAKARAEAEQLGKHLASLK